ncbi:MAG: hypothetical protein ACOZE7_08275 [Pseudomonadota bacterium]
MSQPASILELLEPWSLRADMPLGMGPREAVRTALLNLQAALSCTPAEAAPLIDAALAQLPDDMPRALTPRDTGTPLAQHQVDDYNAYFGVRHVDSELPGVTLVRSMLNMVRHLMDLQAQPCALDQDALAQQLDGLRAQALLLMRALKLDGV